MIPVTTVSKLRPWPSANRSKLACSRISTDRRIQLIPVLDQEGSQRPFLADGGVLENREVVSGKSILQNDNLDFYDPVSLPKDRGDSRFLIKDGSSATSPAKFLMRLASIIL